MFKSNLLLYGDNLDFLRDPDQFPTASVDLIYLDPPFNSNATYNVLFKEVTGEPSAAQIKAFDDTWTWDATAAEALGQLMQDKHTPEALASLVQTFHAFLGHSPMLAYLVQMAVRLVHIRRVLNETGSLYLHCARRRATTSNSCLMPSSARATSSTRSCGTTGGRECPRRPVRDAMTFCCTTLRMRGLPVAPRANLRACCCRPMQASSIERSRRASPTMKGLYSCATAPKAVLDQFPAMREQQGVDHANPFV